MKFRAMTKRSKEIVFLLCLTCVAITNTATTTCFKGILTKVLPAKHVYHRVRKPAIIGYRGSILKHQENTLEGMKDLINRRFDGMHMEVQMLANEQLVLFGDNNFKRLTDLDASTSIASYRHVKDLNLKTKLVYGNKTITYEKSAKIPLLEDVLNAVRGKGLLIYIELLPSNTPPVSPTGRYLSLRTGILVGKLIKKLGMENEVFIVSADPFKLLAVNHENSATALGWLMKTSFYEKNTADRIRSEFVDLEGLRTCYINDKAPTGAAFLPFLLETGIVAKAVNGSFFDADFDVINNPTYNSGKTSETAKLIRGTYNPVISTGAFLSYYSKDGSAAATHSEKKVFSVVSTGVDRIVTDDVDSMQKILYSVSAKGNQIIAHTSLLIWGLLVAFFVSV